MEMGLSLLAANSVQKAASSPQTAKLLTTDKYLCACQHLPVYN